MKPPRINRTYTASVETLAAYPYGGELAGSGIDHRGPETTLVIGAGTPTGPTGYVRAAMRQEQERGRQRLSTVVHDGALGIGTGSWRVCANTPDSRTGSQRHDAGTTNARPMYGTGMTMTRGKRVLPGNEKDRCANTGLSQEESSVVVLGI